MTGFEFVSAKMMSANTMEHVRTIVVSDHQKVREE
jgi:hypothetical protein